MKGVFILISVGIMGCGSIARQRHAYEYSKRDDVKIAGFFDLSLPRAEELVSIFGGRVYRSVEEMLADPAIDAVSVCVSNAFHAQYAIAALNAGKHVLCEKPMATTLEDCESMLAAARQNHKRLCIDQNQRLAPAHAQAKALLDSGALGRVISFQSTFGHKGPEMWSVDKSANTWFFKKSAAAFGSMADLGIHKIDLLRYLIACPVKSVYAVLATLDKKFPDGTPIEVDDNSIEILSFANGCLGTVTTSWTHYAKECNSTILYCEKGTLRMYDDPKYSLEVEYADATKVHYELDPMQTNDDAQQKSSGVIDTFIGGLNSGKTTILDAENVIDSMRVVFACVESANTNKAVTLV